MVNKGGNPRDEEATALKRTKEIIAQQCQKCPGLCHIYSGQVGTVRVFWNDSQIDFFYTTDPGVIEITWTPLTYEQANSLAPIFNKFVFDVAKELEVGGFVFSPDIQRNRWSGHVNVSWDELLGDHSKLALNLFTDLQNFPELSMGVLGGDIRNATPLIYGNLEKQELLKEVIKSYKEKAKLTKYSRIFDPTNIKDLSKLLHEYVVPNSFYGRYGYNKNVPVNMSNIEKNCKWNKKNGERVELRGFFSPMSTDEMLFSYRIVRERLNYLSDQDILDYKPRVQIAESYKNKRLDDHITDGLQGGLTPEQGASAFIRYLKDSGLDPLKEAVHLRDPAVKKAVEEALQSKTKKAS